MKKLVFVLISISGVLCGVIPKNLYGDLYNIAHTKCPYMEKILDNHKFLNDCGIEVKQLDVGDVSRKVEESLCLLYYNNFLYLCQMPEAPGEIISNTTFSTNPKDVCTLLGNNSFLTPDWKVIAGVVVTKTREKCDRMCMDLEDHLKPICSGIAQLVNITSTKPIRVKPLLTIGQQIQTKVVEKVEKPPQEPIKVPQLPAPITQESQQQLPKITAPSVQDILKVEEKKVLESVKLNQTEVKSTVKENTNTTQKQLSAQTHQEPPKDDVIEPKVKAAVVEKKVSPPTPIEGNIQYIPRKDEIEENEEEDADDIGTLPNEDDDISVDTNVGDTNPLPQPSEVKQKNQEKSKPRETDEDVVGVAANYQNQDIDDGDSYFFSYFMVVCIMFVAGYIIYHNKQKILALIIEGRRTRKPQRARRPNSANYHKLDSNLEEAVTSACNKTTTQVIY